MAASVDFYTSSPESPPTIESNVESAKSAQRYEEPGQGPLLPLQVRRTVSQGAGDDPAVLAVRQTLGVGTTVTTVGSCVGSVPVQPLYSVNITVINVR